MSRRYGCQFRNSTEYRVDVAKIGFLALSRYYFLLYPLPKLASHLFLLLTNLFSSCPKHRNHLPLSSFASFIYSRNGTIISLSTFPYLTRFQYSPYIT